MSDLSRRSFIVGAASLPIAGFLSKVSPPVAPYIRYNVTSAQGKAMLAIYSNAVKKMIAKPESSPVGWLFQWYTHAVRDDRTKAAELARIYPTSSAQKLLAQATWDTCQPHHAGGVEDYFLPWHRMYVYYLEQIIRQVSGKPHFTLPYWNYSNSAATSGPRMPQKFISPGTASNPLFRGSRNAGPNGGQPIDHSDPGALNLDALKESSYSPVGIAPGFCQALDMGLHGNVHVLIGDGNGMGSVPWAARDPIFWMHHCNIDRLWASWNKAGRHNPSDPTYLNKTFTFADQHGASVTRKIGEVVAMSSLGYTYDHFESVPAFFISPTILHNLAAARLPLLVSPGSVELGSAAKRVQMQTHPDSRNTLIGPTVQKMGPFNRLYIIIKGLSAMKHPGVVFHVYFDLPEGASPSQSADHYIATINFFSAVGHGDNMHAMGDRFISLDATDVARRLSAANQLSAVPTVTIVPFGAPDAAAMPTIEEISIVHQ